MKPEFRVVNVINRGQINSDRYQQLMRLLVEISTGPDRLANNYFPENMKLDEHLTFDVLVDNNDRIISFSGVYNGGRYPPGVYRILNRTWVSPEYRVAHGSFRYLTSKYILPFQFENFKADLKLVFVSRERLSGRLFLKRWQRDRADRELWTLWPDLVQVVPGVERRSCYQFICSRKFSDVQWSPKTLSYDLWERLPE